MLSAAVTGAHSMRRRAAVSFQPSLRVAEPNIAADRNLHRPGLVLSKPASGILYP
ncbi:hypothetical protein PLICRDRAFT_47114 [Plicaturopsis crispa FD-325 SS-3]|uniref:Uncharacterized protein n=1 Tax=Plicaturopsis crispa FD-325 SS-3 TaxID=944288 RepID=A0A0C9SQD8_PLICR|nr:hypothetical protein PLICRDRAFT_47114 [Plicaturopsis crispa FD-325 SS-3]